MSSIPNPNIRNGSIWVVAALKVRSNNAHIPRPDVIDAATKITPAMPNPACDRDGFVILIKDNITYPVYKKMKIIQLLTKKINIIQLTRNIYTYFTTF